MHLPSFNAYADVVPEQKQHAGKDDDAEQERDCRAGRVGKCLREVDIVVMAKKGKVNRGEDDDVYATYGLDSAEAEVKKDELTAKTKVTRKGK